MQSQIQLSETMRNYLNRDKTNNVIVLFLAGNRTCMALCDIESLSDELPEYIQDARNEATEPPKAMEA